MSSKWTKKLKKEDGAVSSTRTTVKVSMTNQNDKEYANLSRSTTCPCMFVELCSWVLPSSMENAARAMG